MYYDAVTVGNELVPAITLDAAYDKALVDCVKWCAPT